MLHGITSRLEHYMDLLSARQRLVASNIANVDTPGYRTRDVNFRHEGLPVKNDGNDVSLDRESRLLAENALRFQVASSLIRGQIRVVKAAIQEGRGA
jgi:flagellar basal-body rod protein FlgB